MPTPDDVLLALERETARALSLWRRLTGPQLLAGSFLLLIVLGTVLLLTLPGLYTSGTRPSLIDALFMATTAVCITGLTVVDVPTYFTPWGQAVYLLLIQLGGIGILTITTVVILWVGGRITLRSEAALEDTGAIGSLSNARRLFRSILRFTFGIETAGAVVLWLAWSPDLGAAGAIWPAIFHAVSAFCNAGISNLQGGLGTTPNQVPTLVVLTILISLGGIGFLVLEEIFGARRPWRKLSLHTRVVLVTTAAMILSGTIAFGLFEWNFALEPEPAYRRLVQALFMSVTPATAGFASLDYESLTNASLFLTILIMLIGGSPGSTAGGLKTTTLAVLVALAVARIRGDTVTRAFRHTIPETTIQRAVGLVVIVIAALSVAILALQIIELGGTPHQASGGAFMALTFEAVSAISNTGLSLGVTPILTWGGKLLLIALMYIGRVGPLTLAASMVVAARKPRARVRYSTEDLIIG